MRPYFSIILGKKYFNKKKSTIVLLIFVNLEAVSLQQMPPGASVSRVTRIYDRVTNKMMEEMKQELKNMIDKTEVELKEKYIKVT